MKVLVVTTMAPFIWGGAEELAANLEKQLLLAGHDVELLRIPFAGQPPRIPIQMLIAQSIKICNADRVIVLKFPAYLIEHDSKIFWLLHQHREAYDLFYAGKSDINDDASGKDLRDVIRKADNEAFNSAKKIFTNSPVTSNRLFHYNGFHSEILYPPVNDAELFCGGIAKGYIFAGGRINRTKRQHLLVEAMQYTNPKVKLIVAGPPDTIEDKIRLEALVKKHDLTDRVILDIGFLPRVKIAEYVNHAVACAYIPYDEDSLGYVAMEAANAKKPLITVEDSGGVLGLIKNGETGWQIPADPKQLAEMMNMIFSEQKDMAQYGEAMHAHWKSMNITWEKTLEKLLQPV